MPLPLKSLMISKNYIFKREKGENVIEEENTRNSVTKLAWE